MENQYLSEESAGEEWVEIQFPSKPSNSTTNPDDSVVISTEKDGFFIDSEDVVSSANQNPINDINDTNVEVQDEEGSVHEEERKSVIVMGFERLKCTVVAVYSRMRKTCVISSKGRIFTTGFGAVFCLSVFLVCLRIQWKRRQAKLLEKKLQIKEKDQKISELLLEIARLKDILLQRRRVPVLRV